jgi:hypothetical protein
LYVQRGTSGVEILMGISERFEGTKVSLVGKNEDLKNCSVLWKYGVSVLEFSFFCFLVHFEKLYVLRGASGVEILMGISERFDRAKISLVGKNEDLKNCSVLWKYGGSQFIYSLIFYVLHTKQCFTYASSLSLYPEIGNSSFVKEK